MFLCALLKECKGYGHVSFSLPISRLLKTGENTSYASLFDIDFSIEKKSQWGEAMFLSALLQIHQQQVMSSLLVSWNYRNLKLTTYALFLYITGIVSGKMTR
jgi:hypothetical protein